MLLGGGSDAGDELAARFRAREAVCAPHLLDVEVAQVLRRYTLSGTLVDSDVAEMITDLLDLPIRRYPHTFLLKRALELKRNVTVYDGTYLALSEVLEVTLLTGDKALVGVPGCSAAVRFVETGS